MARPVLEVKGLRTSFFTDEGEIPAVNDVTFSINEGEILGVVGESGCGKSVTSLSIMGLVPSPPGKVIGGEIVFKGEDLTKVSEKRRKQIRGNEIAMIYQEPMTSLNPVFTIGNQLIEAVRTHHKVSRREARQKAIEILKRVGLPRVEQLMVEYPHQLSGGMCQRVMIAMAMVCEPEVLIADEPTTALDVTIQAQILDLMRHLNEELQTSILLITHDLGVVAETCDRVIVMYTGQIVEEGTVETIFENPQHPYTKGLIKSVPDLRDRKERLYSIPGNVPKPGTIENGCFFAPRCQYAFERCWAESPHLINTSRKVRCFLYEEGEEPENEQTVAKS